MSGLEYLLDQDREFIKRMGWNSEIERVALNDGAFELQIVIHDYELPSKFEPNRVDLLVRQMPGYPEVGMDMFWTKPDVRLAETNQTPASADVHEENPGLEWQRWSRHMNGWRPSVDCLETFYAAIHKELHQ